MLPIRPVFHDTDNQSENQQDNKENIDRLFHIGLDHNYCASSSFNSDHPEPITRQYIVSTIWFSIKQNDHPLFDFVLFRF